MENILHVGLDVGSTTVKIIVIDSNKQEIYSDYTRHFSDTKNTVCKVLDSLPEKFPNSKFTIALTGSGAMSAATFLGLPFIQEVVACKRAVEKFIPQTDVVIELGGEDAKIIYFDQSIEQRMNGTCAGGTGAFLDQMASLLDTDTAGLNELAKNYSTIYPIASRCGVFAKTDVQPLINEGAEKSDIAASIFQAVVNQTISGLACGRPIRGTVAFLGGPLNYLSELRKRFIETLNLKDDEIVIPDEAHLLVAKGACLDAIDNIPISIEELKQKIHNLRNSQDTTSHPVEPLFNSTEDYNEFSCEVKAIVDFYGVTDVRQKEDFPTTLNQGEPDSPEGKLIGGNNVYEHPELSVPVTCANYVEKDTPIPPILMMHGTGDDTVSWRQSVRLYKKLREEEKDVTFYMLENAVHGDNAFWTTENLNIVDEFLKKHI